jgi:hypothetical protein
MVGQKRHRRLPFNAREAGAESQPQSPFSIRHRVIDRRIRETVAGVDAFEQTAGAVDDGHAAGRRRQRNRA